MKSKKPISSTRKSVDAFFSVSERRARLAGPQQRGAALAAIEIRSATLELSAHHIERLTALPEWGLPLRLGECHASPLCDPPPDPFARYQAEKKP